MKSTSKHLPIVTAISILIAFVFIYLCFCSPFALDDWFYGSSTGIGCMRKGFSTLNGRYLSNMIEMVFSRAFLFRAVCMGACCFGIFHLIRTITGKDNPAITVFSAFVFIAMARAMFKSTVTWSPGFVNYTFSAFLVLMVVALFKDIFTETPVNTPKKALLAFFLGIASCLNIEHVTIYMCMLSIVLIIYSGIRFHQIYSAQITLLIGSIIGTVIMFTNPIYGIIANPDEKRYYKMDFSFSAIIKSSYDCIIEHIIPNLFKSNIILDIVIAVLISLLVFTAIRHRNFTGFKRILLYLCSLYVCGTAAYFYFCHIHTEFRILLNYTPIFEIIMMIVYFICIAIVLFICPIDSSRQHRLIFEAASILMMTAPLLIVSPVADRCFTPMYIFRILLAADLADLLCRDMNKNLLISRVKALFTISTAIFLAFSICYMSIYTYIKRADIARMDALFSQIEAGETTVTLEKLPYASYIFKGAVPLSQKWMNWFKDKYGIDEDITIEIVDFDGIH